MNFFHKFRSSVEKRPDKSALVINDRPHTYQQLYDKAMQIGQLLIQNNSQQVGIFASKTLSAYIGLLGAMASGKTYVPLLDEFPQSRNKDMMDQAKVDTVIIDQGGLKQINEMRNKLSPETLLIFPEMTVDDLPESIKDKFKVFTKTNLKTGLKQVVEVPPDKIMYICFTSGSTGRPKGIPVAHKNWFDSFKAHLDVYHLEPDYRAANGFELTFSISIAEFYLPWYKGATVYPLPKKELSAQINFIKRNKINYWMLSPSNAQSLIRFKMLGENSLPYLRQTIFGGEPLSKSFIPVWQKAAPNSFISNGIGSTECLLYAQYELPKIPKDIMAYNGIVSIGKIIGGVDFCLLNDQNEKQKNKGELCLAGANVFSGYLNRPEKNKEVFATLTDDGKTWFKTGDIVKYENGHLFHLGRKDFMVKIRGGRVDLGEINHVISEFTKASTVHVLPHPVVEGIAHSLYVFMSKDGSIDKAALYKHLRKKLPLFMLPKAIFLMDEFPLNAHRKIDRPQLIGKIKEFEGSLSPKNNPL